MLNRRSLLFGLVAGAPLLAASGSEFWNRKPPSEWSAGEIDRLLTKSPWAKAVKPEYLNVACSLFPSSGDVATVRWESAKPVLLALNAKLTDLYNKHYAISVNGLHIAAGTDCKTAVGDEDLKGLKQRTTLRLKSGETAQSDFVDRQVSMTTNLVFGFRKSAFPHLDESAEVEFSCQLARLAVKAKFTLKEMLYNGELAL